VQSVFGFTAITQLRVTLGGNVDTRHTEPEQPTTACHCRLPPPRERGREGEREKNGLGSESCKKRCTSYGDQFKQTHIVSMVVSSGVGKQKSRQGECQV
jgi:hypothetical protein